ncbi:hypothetical protein SLNSH_08270 [Alsobacter soli]|uniref:Uncharacterized protein n=1 Tax=Alsobacter soli TaxID=2109933 RepID=A0A2T1HVP1_9HYPH|nr:hypothetical protein [Alsobacter soli]PSC05569.1 hypothetical protein SLNSH_08270 [Alsobacter soli]
MHKRIIAIAAAFGAEQRAADLYARSPGFRTLCDDLAEVIRLSETLPRTPENAVAATEYDRLVAELVGELREYVRNADQYRGAGKQSEKGGDT